MKSGCHIRWTFSNLRQYGRTRRLDLEKSVFTLFQVLIIRRIWLLTHVHVDTSAQNCGDYSKKVNLPILIIGEETRRLCFIGVYKLRLDIAYVDLAYTYENVFTGPTFNFTDAFIVLILITAIVKHMKTQEAATINRRGQKTATNASIIKKPDQFVVYD